MDRELTELPVIGATSHASGGRDRWSEPLASEPRDAEEGVRALLREVLDPELPISILDLGLVYGLDVQGPAGARRIEIAITYTATACPCQEFIREDIRDRLEQEPWIAGVEIEEVWSPPWTSERISPRGRAALKQLGVVA